MEEITLLKKVAIVGGGPSGLFLYKTLVEKYDGCFTVDIFEAKSRLGAGMPYSHEGSNIEHITNVSGNEIPKLVSPLTEWVLALPQDILLEYKIDRETFHDYMAVPRLLFGSYLNEQFELLQKEAQKIGMQTNIHLDSKVSDISDEPETHKVVVEIAGNTKLEFDHVIICTGHNWPVSYEGTIPGYFDSPYPPAKLKLHLNHTIAVRGSSLTAIDAIRTLARQHGKFIQNDSEKLLYIVNKDAEDFKIVMHSRNGLLPAIRFHLDDSHLSNKSLLSKKEINDHIANNGGFLSLDYIFEKDFKEPIKEKDIAFYERIQNLTLEAFVEQMMTLRESVDPFTFFKGEYTEAAKSIKREKSIYWKEMLGVLSFAMNYPAKHLSAEDMQRLKKVLMPLISVVIAYVPQSSGEELIALHDAGKLDLIEVGNNNQIIISDSNEIIFRITDDFGNNQDTVYKTFIDCVGQPHLMLKDFPFKSLVQKGAISPAVLKFRSTDTARELIENGSRDVSSDDGINYYLNVPGIAITDSFRVIDKNGDAHQRIHVMAVPYIGGYNPDYSGLDFCEEASKIIVADMLNIH